MIFIIVLHSSKDAVIEPFLEMNPSTLPDLKESQYSEEVDVKINMKYQFIENRVYHN